MGFGSTLGLLFEINADPDHAVTAMKLFEEQLTSSMGVSTESFNKFKEAAASAGEDLLEIGKGVTELGAGLYAAAARAANFAEEVGHVAEKTGATTEQISAMNFAAHQAGVTMEEGAGSVEGFMGALKGVPESSEVVSRALGFLAKNLGDVEKAASGLGAAQSGANASAALQDLGLSMDDARIKSGNMSAILPEILERMAKMTDKTRLASDAQALFGRSGREIIPILEQFKNGMGSVEERAKAVAQLVGEDDVIAAHKFLVEQRQLTAEMNAFALALGKDVMPIAATFLAWLHTASTEAEVFALRLAAWVGVVPTMGGSLLLLQKATQLENSAIQEQTNWLIGLQNQMDAASHAANRLADAQDHAADSGGGKGDKGKVAAGGPLPSYPGNVNEKFVKAQLHDIPAVAHAWDNAAIFVKLFDDNQNHLIQELPLTQQRLKGLATVLSGDGYGIKTTSGGAVASAANAAKVAIDALTSSMDNAGGKTSAISEKAFQAAQAMAQMAQKAQEAADSGETIDPKQQVAGMVQIAAAALLTYKERAIVESVYYAAKSVAAFAAQDYWAGAEYALASGLFAEAAGTASKASSSGGGGGGGTSSSYGRNGSGSGGSGSDGGGGTAVPGGGGGATYHFHLEGPGWTEQNVMDLMGQMSQMAKNGTATLNATNALYNGPKLG